MTLDKKEIIRQAAISVIAERGFHESTVDLIAGRARVSVGTIYNYFRSKEEILSHIFDVEYAKRLAFFKNVSAQARLGPLEKVDGILRFHLDEMKANPDLASLLVREGYSHRACHHRGAGHFRGLSQLLAEILAEGVKDGTLRPHDPGIVAPCLMGAVEAAMALFVHDPDGGKDHLGRATGEVLNLLRHGIQKT